MKVFIPNKPKVFPRYDKSTRTPSYARSCRLRYNTPNKHTANGYSNVNEQIYKSMSDRAKSDIKILEHNGYFNNAQKMHAPSLVIENMMFEYDCQQARQNKDQSCQQPVQSNQVQHTPISDSKLPLSAYAEDNICLRYFKHQLFPKKQFQSERTRSLQQSVDQIKQFFDCDNNVRGESKNQSTRKLIIQKNDTSTNRSLFDQAKKHEGPKKANRNSLQKVARNNNKVKIKLKERIVNQKFDLSLNKLQTEVHAHTVLRSQSTQQIVQIVKKCNQQHQEIKKLSNQTSLSRLTNQIMQFETQRILETLLKQSETKQNLLSKSYYQKERERLELIELMRNAKNEYDQTAADPKRPAVKFDNNKFSNYLNFKKFNKH